MFHLILKIYFLCNKMSNKYDPLLIRTYFGSLFDEDIGTLQTVLSQCLIGSRRDPVVMQCDHYEVSPFISIGCMYSWYMRESITLHGSTFMRNPRGDVTTRLVKIAKYD